MFSTNKNWPMVITLMLIVIIGGLLIGNSVISANNDRNLAGEAINVGDLFRNTQTASAGYVEADSTEHPLSSSSEVADQAHATLYVYKQAYASLAFAPDEAVAIGSFLYQYATPSEAKAAANILQKQFAEYNMVAPVKINQASRSNSWLGQVFTLSGDEGDAVNWFIGTRGTVLYMLFVDGMDREVTQNSFERVLTRLNQN